MRPSHPFHRPWKSPSAVISHIPTARRLRRYTDISIGLVPLSFLMSSNSILSSGFRMKCPIVIATVIKAMKPQALTLKALPHPFASSCPHACIARFRTSNVYFQLNHSQALIVEPLQCWHSFSIWTIDHHDDLKLRIALPKRTFYRAHNPLRSSVRGNYHTY